MEKVEPEPVLEPKLNNFGSATGESANYLPFSISHYEYSPTVHTVQNSQA